MQEENEDGDGDALKICTHINIVNIVKYLQFTLWYIHGDNGKVWFHLHQQKTEIIMLRQLRILTDVAIY